MCSLSLLSYTLKKRNDLPGLVIFFVTLTQPNSHYPYPNSHYPYPTRQLQATLDDKIYNEQHLKQQYKQNEREKDMALKAIGQERRQLDVERYDPIRKFPPIPYPRLQS